MNRQQSFDSTEYAAKKTVTRREKILGQVQAIVPWVAKVRDVIRTVKPSLIVNPAVYTAVDKAESEPDLAMRINGEAPGVMAEEAKKLGVVMIHYSTDYVFVDAQNRPCSEGDPAWPINVYGAAKLAGENATKLQASHTCFCASVRSIACAATISCAPFCFWHKSA